LHVPHAFPRVAPGAAFASGVPLAHSSRMVPSITSIGVIPDSAAARAISAVRLFFEPRGRPAPRLLPPRLLICESPCLILSFSSFSLSRFLRRHVLAVARGLEACQATCASPSSFPAVCEPSAHVSLRLKRGALPVSTDRSIAALSISIMVRSIGGRGV
jgi:hypothetical protein